MQTLKQHVRYVPILDTVVNPDGTSGDACYTHCDVLTFEKEYDVHMYNEEQAKEELVWSNVYHKAQNARFYTFTAQRRNIKIMAVAHIFTPK